MPHNSSQMWINFNNSFNVVFQDKLQKKMVLGVPPHLKHADDYLKKFECSTAQLFMHIKQASRSTYISDLLGR